MSTAEPVPIVDPVPAGSFRDTVRAARAAALARNIKDFEIPGFGGTIWGTFKAIDKIADATAMVKPYTHLEEDEENLMIAAELLERACVGLYGKNGDLKAPLEPPDMRLDLRFAEYVEEGSTTSPDGLPMTNLQALISVIIPNEVHLVTLAVALQQWFSGVEPKVDKEQVGNSGAPS